MINIYLINHDNEVKKFPTKNKNILVTVESSYKKMRGSSFSTQYIVG